jgi:TRAP-type uncharacterized transport system substrate-binding protein
MDNRGDIHAGIQPLATPQRIGCGCRYDEHGFARVDLFHSGAAAMATAFKGFSFEYYGRRYREIFARSHVELDLRETDGAVENVKLLQDPKSGVQIALAFGGISNGEQAPGLLSLGTVYNNPFWFFYSANEQLDRLAQLKGKRIAVEPVGSGTRSSAEQILGKGGVNSTTATLLPFGGSDAVAALNDVRWMLCGSPARRMRRPSIHSCGIPMSGL